MRHGLAARSRDIADRHWRIDHELLGHELLDQSPKLPSGQEQRATGGIPPIQILLGQIGIAVDTPFPLGCKDVGLLPSPLLLSTGIGNPAPGQWIIRDHLPTILRPRSSTAYFSRCPLTSSRTATYYEVSLLSRSRLSFSRSAARTKSAMLTSSSRAARSISRNMAFGMRAWIGVLSAAVNTFPRLRFRGGLVGSRFNSVSCFHVALLG